MSMYPEPIFDVPELTAEVAQAAFPKGNRYLKMRDELGTVYTDDQFADLYPQVGQPAASPWRLALITVVQFAEEMTDREAADAVRSRIDLKYLLGLELNDPGFDFSVLSEFRTRLLSGAAEERLLQVMLALCQERKWLKTRGQQRTDSTHILGSVRDLNRLEIVGETLHYALNILAQVDPGWLKAQVTPEWFDRYSQRLTGIASVLPITACRKQKGTVWLWQRSLGGMGITCCLRFMPPLRRLICEPSRPLMSCARCGYSISISKERKSAGATRRTFHLLA